MKRVPASKSIQFYLLLFSILLGIIFLLQLIFLTGAGNKNIYLSLCFLGLTIIFFQFRFIKKRFIKELELLWKSIRLVIDHNFSRRFKLHQIRSEDEIGQISMEVTKMLDRLHYRTTEVLLRRKELTEAAKNVEMLGSIGQKITSKLSIQDIIRTTFENVSQLLDASLLAIGIWDNEKKGLNFYGIRQVQKDVIYGFEDMHDENRWGVYCFNHQKEIFCNEFDTCSKYYFSSLLFSEKIDKRESFIYLPLSIRDQKIGVFTVQSFSKNAYSVYHINLLRNLANYIIVAITNAHAFKQIEDQKEELENISYKLKQAQQYLEQQVAQRTQALFQQNIEIEKKNKELERLSLVARKTDNAIMIMDSNGNIEWVNDCFSRIYNYTFEEFLSKRGNNILQTSFYPQIDQVLKKCINTRKSVYYEAANITGDGREIWTQTTLTPVVNNFGEITHLLTIDSDISKRKEYELTLTRQARDIKQSILYAKQIQHAVLPPEEWFSSVFKEHFIIYKPKDIVSGDFYWISHLNDLVVLALGDCTGHGVPGALMSMLAMSLLNELTHSGQWRTSAELMNLLRTKIKSSLRQNHTDYSNADGMDLALCLIEKRNRKVHFSGANNSLFFIRNKQIEQIKGDKMPVGLYINDDKPFQTIELDYMPGDKFYLCTDGYIDQFGGERDSKFTVKRFKDLLLDIHLKKFIEQKNSLEETIQYWQGNNPQIDDISVLGFELI